MNSNIVKLLLGLCLLSLVVLLIEWGVMVVSNQQLNDTFLAEDQQQTADLELPVIELAKLPIDSYADMVDRPLFIKGRKAVAVVDEQNSFLDTSKIEDLLLLGIFSIEGRKNAMFNKQGGDGKVIKKVEGDDVYGWMLKEIKTDQVILEQDGKEHPIMLRKARVPVKSRKKRQKKSFKKPRVKRRNSMKLKS